MFPISKGAPQYHPDPAGFTLRFILPRQSRNSIEALTVVSRYITRNVLKAEINADASDTQSSMLTSAWHLLKRWCLISWNQLGNVRARSEA